MIRWLSVLVTAAVLSGFAFLLVTGEYANDGPVVLPITNRQGLHAGDFLVLAGWLLAMLAVARLGLGARRGDRG